MGRLLVIEDSPAQRTAIRAALAETPLFDAIDEAEDGAEGLRCLMSREYALVLCDVEMPALDGSKLLHASRQQPGGGPPFLMLTAVRDARTRAALLRSGARDVIAKPFDALELQARVELHLEIVRLQDELAGKNESLAALAATDALTGIANRRRLEEVVEFEWKRAERYGTPLSLVMIDVDRFKRVNDNHGHASGDQVLREVAQAIARQIRATDSFGRWGGEEFLAVVGVPAPGALIAAEKWRQAVAEVVVKSDAGAAIRPTVSLGVATRGPELADATALIAAADHALYLAKRSGRNRVAVAKP